MGLDMYLSVRKYISQVDWNLVKEHREKGYNNLPDNPLYEKLIKDFDLTGLADSGGNGGGYVMATSIYWRKANHIHQWFVENCAGGEDDCKPVYVSREKLEELYSTVCEVLANRDDLTIAEDLLPTQTGFFFGASEIGEWYWEHLEYTRSCVKELLKASEDRSDIDFEYHASW
jgi:hypothetical protein